MLLVAQVLRGKVLTVAHKTLMLTKAVAVAAVRVARGEQVEVVRALVARVFPAQFLVPQ